MNTALAIIQSDELDTIQRKQCGGCGQWQLLDNFYKDSSKADGRNTRCKVCRKAADKARYDQQHEQILAQKKEYYAENRDALLQKNKEWNKRNRDYLREYGKKKAARNVAYRAEYREKNRETHRVLYQAKKAVARAIKRGELPPVNTLACLRCGEQAQNYHHASYDRDKWLDVTPFCRSCHSIVHVEMRKGNQG